MMSFTFRFSTACTFRSTVDDSGLIRFLPKAGVDAKGTKDDPGGEFSFFFSTKCSSQISIGHRRRVVALLWIPISPSYSQNEKKNLKMNNDVSPIEIVIRVNSKKKPFSDWIFFLLKRKRGGEVRGGRISREFCCPFSVLFSFFLRFSLCLPRIFFRACVFNTSVESPVIKSIGLPRLFRRGGGQGGHGGPRGVFLRANKFLH